MCCLDISRPGLTQRNAQPLLQALHFGQHSEDSIQQFVTGLGQLVSLLSQS